MSSMPVAWHEENLKNMRASLSRYREELERYQYSVERLSGECAFLESQIARAKDENKSKFDCDKYNKGRG
jgi:predicted RNase H-like nuclease (RuvC/YqgF family)